MLVPVEHAPFESPIAAIDRELAKAREHRLANAAAAVTRLDVEVFEVEAGLREEGREVGEEQGEGDDRAFAFGEPFGRQLADQRFGHRLLAEQMRSQFFRRDLQQVRELLELCQLADQRDDGRHIAQLGGAQGKGDR